MNLNGRIQYLESKPSSEPTSSPNLFLREATDDELTELEWCMAQADTNLSARRRAVFIWSEIVLRTQAAEGTEL